MVALKAAEADRFLANPPESVNVVLIYGPDTELVPNAHNLWQISPARAATIPSRW